MQKSVDLRIYLSTVYDTYRSAGSDTPFSIVQYRDYSMISLPLLDTEVGPGLTSGNTDASSRINGVALEA